MKTTLIPLNVKNLNGRIYTNESFSELKDRYCIEIHNADNYSAEVSLDKVIGEVENVRLENDAIVGEPKLLNIKHHDVEMYNELLKSGEMVLRPKSIGNVSEDGHINNSIIVSFTIIRKDDDSFKDTIK
jgi:hypothetical protein